MPSSDRQYTNRLFYRLTVPQNRQNARLLAPSVTFLAVLLTIGLQIGITTVRCYTKSTVSRSTPVCSSSQKAPMTSRCQVCYTKHPISCSAYSYHAPSNIPWYCFGQKAVKRYFQTRNQAGTNQNASRCAIPAGRSRNMIRYAT